MGIIWRHFCYSFFHILDHGDSINRSWKEGGGRGVALLEREKVAVGLPRPSRWSRLADLIFNFLRSLFASGQPIISLGIYAWWPPCWLAYRFSDTMTPPRMQVSGPHNLMLPFIISALLYAPTSF